MNRKQKEVVVASLKDSFSESAASFLVGVKGLTVEQLETLRKRLRAEEGRLQVAKVRLMKRALQDVEAVSGLEPHMGEQIGLVFAKNEVPAIAKVICDFSKESNQLKVIVGAMEADILDESAINTIASLPSREVLLAQVARGVQAPIANFANITYQLIARLAFVLKQVEQKKQNNE